MSEYHVILVHLLMVTADLLVPSSALCTFPEFMTRKGANSWQGDYKEGNHFAIFMPTEIKVREPTSMGQNLVYVRQCYSLQDEGKYIVYEKNNGGTSFFCMQFIPRGDTIVQFKVSRKSNNASTIDCEDSAMAYDNYPLVRVGYNSSVTCPFSGGYNIRAFYPNSSDICTDIQLIRLESECDKNSGITLNFRREECVPRDFVNGRVNRIHHLSCVTHWTLGDFTFIILQHKEYSNKFFCLRTKDPLNNIAEAHLFTKLVCETEPIMSVEHTPHFIELKLSKKIFSSTCEDDLDECHETSYYCDRPERVLCAQSCDLCKTESDIGSCTFGEQFRGRWIESSKFKDTEMEVQSYSMNISEPSEYKCLDLDTDQKKHQRVMVQLFSNGCYPRYVCLELEKVTSSVMKYRMGRRLVWPLEHFLTLPKWTSDVCKAENFVVKSETTHELQSKLLVTMDQIKEVPCELPQRLEKVAFKDNSPPHNCGGCLHYDSSSKPTQFSISPVNCSVFLPWPLQYSCLASNRINNDTYTIVTKTRYYEREQFLYWRFDILQGTIKVLKVADALAFEADVSKSDLIVALFSIVKSDNLLCKNYVQLPPFEATTPHPASQRDDNNANNVNNDRNNYETQLEVVVEGNDDRKEISQPINDKHQIDSPKSEGSKNKGRNLQPEFVLVCFAASLLVHVIRTDIFQALITQR
ncbi:uncharacterized protein LOC131956645 [Physella acuta]|uniref:uncharacterized protein LOC131956645 n=1 Tax=Physella acuta TaxID=109671 RepID=UPI0027DDEAAC|nr:uncharacterized protein LOC131956645 [Physella acuta]